MNIAQAFELALEHHRAGRTADAGGLYRQILEAQPNHAGALHFLGVIADQAGQPEVAVQRIRQSIALEPHDPSAHFNLAGILFRQNSIEESIRVYQRALELRPAWPEAQLNLGIALRSHGSPDAAATAYLRALQLKPDWPEALNNFGNAQRDQGQLEEAATAYRRAIALNPDYAEAHGNLAVTLAAQGRAGEAIVECRHALALQPNHPEAYVNLGNLLTLQGELDEAVASYRRALELRPDHPQAGINLGNAFKAQGRLDEAVAAYRRALVHHPEDAGAHSNLIHALHYLPGLDRSEIAREHASWNRQFSDPVKQFIRPHRNDRNSERRLRVGYVSPDFRDHVVGRNILPLFRSHDRREFEIFGYSGVVKPDAMTEELRRHTDQWQSTVGLNDERLAETIRLDEVDILVDLAQHTGENRLTMFARHPAPVQMSFAGYPDSAGVEAIGCRISDRWLESEMEDGRSEIGRKSGAELRSPNPGLRAAERLFLLDSFWCYDPCGIETSVGELPAEANGRITFGCLSNFCKINDPVLRLWAKVLGEVEDSRLVLLSPIGSHRQRTVEFLEGAGIASRRVEFVAPCSRPTYFEWYGRIDLVLDPFPYNGHTTSLDALWMGVPVVSLAGHAPVARGGLSILNNLGRPELIANSDDEYVAIARELAHNRPRLAKLRAELRPQMQASVLMDAPRFARQIESAYRTAWRQWCMEDPTP